MKCGNGQNCTPQQRGIVTIYFFRRGEERREIASQEFLRRIAEKLGKNRVAGAKLSLQIDIEDGQLRLHERERSDCTRPNGSERSWLLQELL